MVVTIKTVLYRLPSSRVVLVRTVGVPMEEDWPYNTVLSAKEG